MYSDGSSTGSTRYKGYKIYIRWPASSTFLICGPEGEQICSFDREFKAVSVTASLKIIAGRQQEEAALPGMAIFSDCGRWYRLWADPIGKTWEKRSC
ncbi:hypothetical protein PoB_006467000 [Plakobranchus ocellatus]|uniref:Uncharacterized protein n=1 Tax=Plakobranchus ocellatus TaxID=259542 RepID=A0AAV4D277_9GAST|nr:hypothetical protein PoB_006467000 [Plakobranchus ocellatus]